LTLKIDHGVRPEEICSRATKIAHTQLVRWGDSFSSIDTSCGPAWREKCYEYDYNENGMMIASLGFNLRLERMNQTELEETSSYSVCIPNTTPFLSSVKLISLPDIVISKIQQLLQDQSVRQHRRYPSNEWLQDQRIACR
jgi:hypothetical protein